MSTPMLAASQYTISNTYPSPPTALGDPTWKVGDIVAKNYGYNRSFFRVEKEDVDIVNNVKVTTFGIRKICDSEGWSPKKPAIKEIEHRNSGTPYNNNWRYNSMGVVDKQSLIDEIKKKRENIDRFETKLQVMFP